MHGVAPHIFNWYNDFDISSFGGIDIRTPTDNMFNHASVFYRTRWLAKATWHVKARDVKSWQRYFPVGFLVRVCALNFLLINVILQDGVARIENRCIIKTKHVLLVC